MKKFYSLIIILICLILVGCSNEHIHSYKEEITNPTCTEKGISTFRCECGSIYKDKEVKELGHSYSEWQVIKQATETEKGLKEKVCSRCNDKIEEEIPMLSHTHNYTEKVVNPTCLSAGYTEYTCGCGETYKDKPTNALGHAYGEWVVVKEATETEKGLKEKKCNRCNDKVEEEIPMLSHTHNYTEKVINPTCTEKGYTEYTCKCGDTYQDKYVNPLDHNYTEWKIIKEATETEKGLKEKTCSRCNDKVEQEIPELSHVHNYTEKVINPTCLSAGYTEYKCSCGDTYKDKPTNALGHKEVVDSKVEATCTQKGKTEGKHCSVCNEVLLAQKEINELGHNYSEWTIVKQPTETEKGLKEKICSRCNDKVSEEIDTVDHIHSYSVLVVNPTCTEQGYTRYSCNCGFSYRANIKDIIPHSGGQATCIEKAVCSMCNQTYGSYSSHKEVIDISIPATCTENGLTEGKHCSVCNTVIMEQKEITMQDCVFMNGNCKWCESSEGLLYTIKSNGECSVYIGTCTSINIKIASNYQGAKVTSIGLAAFINCTSLTSIEIPSSVTSIGVSAFGGCTSLTSIEIPSSVTSIGNHAFDNCTSLTSIEIPSSVTSMGTFAFYNCTSLTSIEIPSSVTSIGNYAFYNCTSLTNVYYSGTIEEWLNISFESSYSNPMFYASNFYLLNQNGEWYIPNSITIPSSVTSIGNYAFKNCTSLTSIEIPSSVTSIGVSAFGGCTSLTSITIQSGVTSIGESAFSSCTSLTSIEIPSSVTSIGVSAFSGCTSLTSIEIPSSVTSIGDSAFRNCTSLTSIEIPSSVTSIGDSAFYECTSLTNVYYSGTIEEWLNISFGSSDSNPMYYASNFYMLNQNGEWYIPNSITIPSSVTSICKYAFYNCTSLTSIEIPSSVTTMGDAAFRNCTSLTNVYYSGTIEEWLNISFGSSDSNPMYYASNFYMLNQNGEWYIPNSITIPSSVTSIGGSAFYGCRSLTSIEIPSSVTTIGDAAFSCCTSLTSIEIPSSVTSIGNHAFRYCTSLTSIEIPSSVTSIGKYAFYGCKSLTSIEIPSSVTSIGGYAFYECTRLTSIEIPSSVTSIGDAAFRNCTRLTSIEIPLNVTTIGDAAFSGCTSLTIYCEVSSKPEGWHSYWDRHIGKVVWGYKNEFTVSYDAAGGILYKGTIDDFAFELVDLFNSTGKADAVKTTKENFCGSTHPNVKYVFNNEKNLTEYKWLIQFAYDQIKAKATANGKLEVEYVSNTLEMLEKMLAGDTTAIGGSYANGRTLFRHFLHNLINKDYSSQNSTFHPYSVDFSTPEKQAEFEVLLPVLESTTTVVKYNEVENLIVPTKEGFEFVGWFDADGNKVEKITADVALTAKWEKAALNTVVDIIEAASKLAADEKLEGTLKITGKVTEITEAYTTQYKNISFKLSDGTAEILCFKCKGDAAEKLAIGDTITVTGEVQNYKGNTVEFVYAQLSDLVAVSQGPVATNSININGTEYATLAKAVAAAKEGDIIYVPAGEYTDELTISVNNVKIYGPNFGVKGNETRKDEAVFKGVITLAENVKGFTFDGCKVDGEYQLSLSNGNADVTFQNNVLGSTSKDGMINLQAGSVSNLVANYNFGEAYPSLRFIRTGKNTVVDGVTTIGNDITGTASHYDFLNCQGILKGKVVIADNKFVNSQQSFIYVINVGVIDCLISGNYVESTANTIIDFRDMKEDGANKFVIEYNEFVAAGAGWMPIRIRTAGYDANDSCAVLVENNKFIESYYDGDGGVPQFVRDNGGNLIYTIGRNYYEVNGEALTTLTANNFYGHAVSFAEAYAKAEDVPAKK